MKAQGIFAQTRLYVGDAEKVKFADWQICQGINDALRLLAEESARANGSWFRERAEFVGLNEASGRAELPVCFIKEIRAFGAGGELLNVHASEAGAGEFSIRGRFFYSGEDRARLWYFAYPAPVEGTVDEEVEIPDSLLLPAAQAAAACMSGQLDGALEVVRYIVSGQPVRPANLGGEPK